MYNPKLFRKDKGYNPHLSITTTITEYFKDSDYIRLTLGDLSLLKMK